MNAKKSAIDQKKAAEIEAAIISNLRLAMAYADIALRHDDVFDHGGMIMSSEKFLSHARLVAERLKELRHIKGVLD